MTQTTNEIAATSNVTLSPEFSAQLRLKAKKRYMPEMRGYVSLRISAILTDTDRNFLVWTDTDTLPWIYDVSWSYSRSSALFLELAKFGKNKGYSKRCKYAYTVSQKRHRHNLKQIFFDSRWNCIIIGQWIRIAVDNVWTDTMRMLKSGIRAPLVHGWQPPSYKQGFNTRPILLREILFDEGVLPSHSAQCDTAQAQPAEELQAV